MNDDVLKGVDLAIAEVERYLQRMRVVDPASQYTKAVRDVHYKLEALRAHLTQQEANTRLRALIEAARRWNETPGDHQACLALSDAIGALGED